MDTGVTMHEQRTGESGFSLIETVISMGVLAVGAIGLAAVFVQGLQRVTSAPNELIATQKAAEAVESVFSARDTFTLTWAQIRNVSDGGIFLDQERPMNLAGDDGILNTGDDGETLESADLARFTRQILIRDLSPDLREITVVIRYPAGSTMRTYTLTAYISAVA